MKNISAVDQELDFYLKGDEGREFPHEEKEGMLDKLMNRYNLSSTDTPDLDMALSDILDAQVNASMGIKKQSVLAALKQIQEHSDNELIIANGLEINIQDWINEIEGKEKVKVDKGPTLLSFTVSNLRESMKIFEGQFRGSLEESIRLSLDRLNEGESISLNGDSCDGEGIATLTYNDAINSVNKEGTSIVYNNNSCEDNGLAYGEPQSIFGWPLEVMIEIANCVDDYMKETGRATYLNK